MPGKIVPITKERLLANREIDKNDCWNWTKALRNGYGHLRYNYKLYYVHRLAYILWKGNIEDDILVCHTCDNPKCFNPEHLFTGTSTDNLQDASRKGRMHQGENHKLSKLTVKKVKEMRSLRETGLSFQKIADKYSVDITTAHKAIIGKNWKKLVTKAEKAIPSKLQNKKKTSKEKLTKDKETSTPIFRTLNDKNITWSVYEYKWDYNSYALPDEGWHPNKEAKQIAKDLTKDQAEKLAKKTNIANRPKYEAMLEKERKKFEKLTEKKAIDAKVWTEKRKK